MIMKKILLLTMLAVVAMTVSAATKYEINVGNVEVTSDNANYITGGDITGGYGVYNASTNTLTLYNMTIYRTGQDKYGIHNRKCDNLKIVFSGSCSIKTADNALKLERATTLNAASGSNTLFYSSARICANLKSYNYYITGSGTMLFDAGPSAYEAIKGEGTSSTKVYFQGAKVTAYSKQRSALSSFAAYLQSGTDLTIEGNGSNASVSGVSMTFSGNTTILEPYGAYYSSNSMYNSSGSQITSGNIYISDNYALLINSSNFPNANFRTALLALYPKGYLTTTQLQNLTSLNVSGKGIGSLTGVEKFTYLKTLDCSNNSLTSLPSLPNSIQEVYAYNNKFTTLTIAGNTKLVTLDLRNNTLLTTLNCYSNALTSLDYGGCTALKTLDCANNKLTSLAAVPSAVTKFNCSANQLTQLPTLPSGLQELECAVNKLYSLSVQGLNSLSRLVIYNNQIKENAMGTLVNSLRNIPAGSTGTFLALGGNEEGNVITTAQVKTARDKRWIPKEMINGDWVEIPAGAVPGDVDGDGHVGSADITALYNYLLNSDSSSLVNGDQNGDGSITSGDITFVYSILLGS